MSLSGQIEDVSIADVLQFIYLGGRTGTLAISSNGRCADIGVHRGRIVSAKTDTSTRLGDILLDEGLISQDTLSRALDLQAAEAQSILSSDGRCSTLGQIFIDMGVLSDDEIRKAVESQIEQTVFEAVAWTAGNFEFRLDELEPVDDIGLYPGDIVPRVELNTQMVLVEAMRIFDERNRDSQDGTQRQEPPRPPAPTPPNAEAQASPIKKVGSASQATSTAVRPLGDERPNLQIVSKDRAFIRALSQSVPKKEARLTHVRIHQAGTAAPGTSSPIVALDMRGHNLGELTSLRRSRPRAVVIAITESTALVSDLLDAGALTVVPAQPKAVTSSFFSLLRHRRDCSDEEAVKKGVREGFAKLQRVFGDLRSGLLSTTMSLNLMNIISESAERAVLLLVRNGSLMTLGAFGFGADGSSLAKRTSGLIIDGKAGGSLSTCALEGRVQITRFDEAGLPADLEAILGAPRSEQCAVFPVSGGRRVIAVVYTDNGRLSVPVHEIELISLAASQVGVAFENELLHRRLDKLRQQPAVSVQEH